MKAAALIVSVSLVLSSCTLSMDLCARTSDDTEGRRTGKATEVKILGITVHHAKDQDALNAGHITSVRSVHLVKARSVFGLVQLRTWYATGE